MYFIQCWLFLLLGAEGPQLDFLDAARRNRSTHREKNHANTERTDGRRDKDVVSTA